MHRPWQRRFANLQAANDAKPSIPEVDEGFFSFQTITPVLVLSALPNLWLNYKNNTSNDIRRLSCNTVRTPLDEAYDPADTYSQLLHYRPH